MFQRKVNERTQLAEQFIC